MSLQVPIVDLSPLSSGDTHGSDDVVETIGRACENWGFFQVVNHGISDPLLQRVWAATWQFFALPRAQKLAISRSKGNPRGYYDRELTKNARDLKEVFDFGKAMHPELPDDHPRNHAAVDGHNQWPSDLPSFRSTMLEYFQACESLGLEILRAFCLSLGQPGERLHQHFIGNHTSFVRLNYYPLHDPLEPQESTHTTALGDMALHHHTDAGALTILLQDNVGGLQVFAHDEWIDVTPVDGAFVINLGDMMQVWSNDRYKAALHRVLPRKEQERYSIPFFFNPSYETDYAPLPSLAGDEPKYRTLNWGDFRQARTDGDYADYGKEIQIADYRIECAPS
ncbi:MAG: isopenicillin N synthase family dioxygenase [Gemmatimonadales bacterium]